MALFSLIKYFPETQDLNVRKAFCEYWGAWQKSNPRFFPPESPMIWLAAQRAPMLVDSILRADIFPESYPNANLKLALRNLFGNAQAEGGESSSAVILL